ncbi:phage tail tape measure protein [Hungatella effluvii]|uniref:phage tail tape measure protein n=1 Tax=Hungatella effluvii TaxID=1096246 RepID=UPI002A7FA8E8|nr:phage tail tape measure protein [Hungatella effluvii]
MANKEYELAIKIAGMVEQSLNEACNLTKKQLRAVAKEAAASSKESVSFGDAMNRAGSGIDSLWGGATQAVKTTAEALLAAGAAAGVVGGLVINVGSDFESAFAGVKKTVDATDQQLADLEEGLRDMAKNMPMTAVELSGIAEAAGQLGIHTENIEDFTKTMADLSVATNLSTEVGASQLAKFANITGMAQDKFENLGSSIVDLGNHMATTEADIVEMGMRLAGAGTQVGMSEADIMGLASALSSVGIEAEAGGSAMSKMMVNMQLAVETGVDAWGPLEESLARTGHTTAQAESAVATGGKALTNFAAAVGLNAKQLKASVKEAQGAAGSLQDFADVANMTSEEFAAAFKDNAAKAIGAFVSGLNDTDRLGQSAIVTLDSMDIKEVRLRDTLLRAANASGLFNDAIDMANNAFEENTALTREADQRYQTFESRLDMVKNRVTDMGITLYQDFRDPLSDCLDVALDFTESDLFDSSKIEKLSKDFKKSIPTIIRQVDDAKDAFIDFAHPLFEIGDWMIENPDVIAGTLAGIGTTIASLKLAQTVTGVAGAMKELAFAMASNPVTATIGLAALAGGAIIGVSTKIKMANAELKKQKLANSFGDITLSLGELQDAAKQILGEEDLKQLSAAMEELGKVSDIADDINNSSDAISKLTWKVNMGLSLDEADTGQFEDAINSMIDNSIDLVEQAQYTAHLNVNALFGENDETGQQLIAGFDAMYSDINGEVTELGRQLGDAYNSAMEDGIIDTDEAKLIQELQAQLARITNQVAQSQVDAKLERIRIEYTGKELDSDTFQNLQKEIQDQLDEAVTASNQSYEYDLGALNLRLERSQSGDIEIGDSAYLTQEMYDSLKRELDASLSEKQMELELKGLSFQTQSITDAFSGELENIVPQMGTNLSNAMRETLNYIDWSGIDVGGWSYDQIAQWLNLDSLDKTTKDTIKDLWKSMEPQFQDMLAMKKQYEAAGKEIPKDISEGINNAASIGILAGSVEALYTALGDTAGNSMEFQRVISLMKENGVYIPEAFSEAMSLNASAVESGIDDLYNHAQSYMQSRFGKIQVYGNVDFNMKVGEVTTRQSSTANPHGVVVNKHADGGIFDTPHYGVFAEEGPEAFIPLNNSPQSVSIWRQAGERLGVLGGSNQSRDVSFTDYSDEKTEKSITYSPVYQIYGADEETVRNATTDDYERFEKFMEQHEKSKRLSFS